ncbi:hypothetical protein F7734_25950 [Scytonema sp. UIC 10036]|uniref:CopG family antitoxin n=1 Tax=Scytonema sp. UIC 10036 TaxID=2304196 RepID=UPI0012DA25D5|nr:CopG family antitoxin [Scytonema sp. UIC 10036]MUG95612.1 hypothetical protein [Scytonema sp. UIC 10036]
MSDKQKRIDPIPNEFSSLEDAAEFWDTHDTTDYLDNFETVPIEETQLKQRHFEVEVDMDLMKVLYEKAQQKQVGIRQLVNEMLREQLRHVA